MSGALDELPIAVDFGLAAGGLGKLKKPAGRFPRLTGDRHNRRPN
jgi:hypothetical protein